MPFWNILADQATACRDKQQAEHYMREHLSELEDCANQVLAENGFGYTARAYLGRFEFPDKTYGDVTYPGRAVRRPASGAGPGGGAKLVVRHVPAIVHRQ